jgi:NADH pyrophosphatase NudC (nudix superfamily)
MPDASRPVAETFAFCPNCGSKPESVGQSPFRCSSCDYGFYFSPAAAVGGIIVNEKSEVLLLIRARDPGKGCFGLPGGFTDAGETLEKSLVREVMEETSLAVSRMSYLCSFPNSYPYRGVTVDVLDVFFVCEVRSFDDLKVDPGEVEGYFLGHPDDEVLDKLAFASNRSALELFLEQRTN